MAALRQRSRRFARGLFLLLQLLCQLLHAIVRILDAVEFLARLFKVVEHFLHA